MHYTGNSSLRRIGDSWHYVESRASESFRSHHLVKVAADEYLDSVLACAKSGYRSFPELVSVVSSCKGSEGFSTEEINNYLHELIDSEVIVPSILPVLTGRPTLDTMLEEINKLPSGKEIYNALSSVKASLSRLDLRPLDVRPEEYDSVAKQLDELPAKVDRTRILQVDMSKPIQSANLGQAVLDEIYGALGILSRVTVPVEPPDLVHFRKAFSDRYEKRWIPLIEALDMETGLTYGPHSIGNESPLLQELPLAGMKPSDDINNLDEFQTVLNAKTSRLRSSR